MFSLGKRKSMEKVFVIASKVLNPRAKQSWLDTYSSL